MSEKKKVTIVNLITGSRIIGTLLLPVIASMFGPLGTAIYIGSLWVTDAIDGYLAKWKWKVSTIFGANFDAFSDKVFGIAILIYLSSFYPFMIMPLIAEFAIFGVNWHYGRKGSDVKSSYLGKFKSGVLDISTVLALLSTLTNGLTFYIPIIINLVALTQAATLIDYVNTNRQYLKNNQPKNDVSHMGFFETIKTIIKKLGDKNIYSPEYYKEHKDKPLLDMLLYKEENHSTKLKKSSKLENVKTITEENDYKFTIRQENELKIAYCLNYNEIQKLEQFAKTHKLDSDLIMSYLSNYIKTINPIDYPTISEMEKFIIEEEKKQKTKGFKEML